MDNPLLNPESPHYQMLGGLEAIEIMESLFTKEELMAWAKLTSYKYRLRIGSKKHNDSIYEGIISDGKKILTYEAYYTYLKEKGNEDD
jgi:hypothetical protein